MWEIGGTLDLFVVIVEFREQIGAVKSLKSSLWIIWIQMSFVAERRIVFEWLTNVVVSLVRFEV